MATLRHRLIRLAHENPTLRKDILPLLREAREFPTQEALKSYLEEHPGADKSKHWVADTDQGGQEKEEAKAPAKKGLFTSDEHSLPKNVGQKTKDPDALFEHAKEAHEQQLDWLNRGKGIDKAIGATVKRCDKGDCDIDYDKEGPIVLIGPMKKKERSKEKVDAEYDGDWSKLSDVVRASIAVDSFDQIEDVVAKLRKSGMQLAKPPKDRFAEPTDAGYRDIALNVVYPNGHIGELQIHLKPILKAKDAGHKHYEVARSIGATAKKEGRDTFTDEEKEKMDKAMSAMQELYDTAWSKATGGGKARGKKGADIKKTVYVEYEGNPARWDWASGKLPVRTTSKGESVVYELDKFIDGMHRLTKSEYDKMVADMKEGEEKKSKKKGGSIRESLIRLAHANPTIRPHILPLLRTASEWENTLIGNGVRVRWGSKSRRNDTILVEELPGKPLKRKVRRCEVGLGYFSNYAFQFDEFIYENIMRDAKLTIGMDYDRVVSALKDAVLRAAKVVEARDVKFDFGSFGGLNMVFREDLVFYLEVEPSDYKPIVVDGKDFSIKATWNEFKSYSPDSDLQNHDPSYTLLISGSPAAARKFYKTLKANPDLLKSVSWNGLGDWLTKMGIGFDYRFSVWR